MNKNLAKTNTNNLMPWSLLKNGIWDVFDSFERDLDLPLTTSVENFTPRIEMKDIGKAYRVSAEVPGMDEKDLSITLQNNALIIEGEKRNEVREEDKKGFFHSEFSYGKFYRAIPLSDDIDKEKIKASYKNGVLSVEMDKFPEKVTQAKKIAINAAKEDAKKVETKH